MKACFNIPNTYQTGVEEMKQLQKAFRKDLVQMLEQSPAEPALTLVNELKQAGQYGYATDDEIERFLDVLDELEEAA